jgi:hypothetical protein
MDQRQAADFAARWERDWNALRCTVEAVDAGVDAVVINYRNHAGNRVYEVLTLDGPLVSAGQATYGTDSAAAASGLPPAA